LNRILSGSKFQNLLESQRLEWINLLQQPNHNTLADACEADPHLCRILKTRDPCFFYNSGAQSPPSELKRDMSSFWEQRDEALSMKIADAVHTVSGLVNLL
jgi:hypothetical protein